MCGRIENENNKTKQYKTIGNNRKQYKTVPQVRRAHSPILNSLATAKLYIENVHFSIIEVAQVSNRQYQYGTFASIKETTEHKTNKYVDHAVSSHRLIDHRSMLCTRVVVIAIGTAINDRNGIWSSIRESRRGPLGHIGFETERPTDKDVWIPP